MSSVRAAPVTPLRSINAAEIAILVSDRFQRLGIGTELMRRLVEIARHEKLRRIKAEILPENTVTQKLLARFGFKLTHSIQDGVVKGELALT